ncbi:MAG: hypothetical protein ABL860_10240, partial [Candidatus Nitrotoga sp.]
ITTSHLTNPAKDAGQVIGYSHPTKQPKDGCKVVGYSRTQMYCLRHLILAALFSFLTRTGIMPGVIVVSG